MCSLSLLGVVIMEYFVMLGVVMAGYALVYFAERGRVRRNVNEYLARRKERREK